RNPRPGPYGRYRRFVPAVEVQVVEGEAAVAFDRPMVVPLSRTLGWAAVQRMSQTPRGSGGQVLGAVRDSVRIRRGTRMVKVLSAGQLAGYLRGWLPQGFCYREFDVAHLRTPAELAV